jgi:hypothetical protein
VGSLIAAAILSPALLYGQLGQVTTSSVTVTATQAAAAQPSEAVFQIIVYAPLSTSLADAAASLSSIGITPSNLVSVNSALLPNFSSSRRSPAKATAAALAALQNSIAQNNSGLTLSFSVSSYGLD